MRPIERLYRYPVKGLSPEPVAAARVEPGQGFPCNRMFALALADTPFDPAAPAPQPKTRFLMLQRDESLAELTTRYDETQATLTIAQGDETVLVADLGEPEGRAAVEDFFMAFMGARLRGRPRLVSAPGFQFTDVSVVSETMMRAVSLINQASVEALAARVGRPVHHLRFRANIYFAGLSPWEEFDWIGREIMLGTVRARVVKRTMRCAATQVNPETARRDLDLPRALRDAFGHADMGVYAEIVAGGTMRQGDAIALA
jgi:uncharacterized protein